MSTWYDGMTNEEIYVAISEGRAPGSREPGAVIKVPAGFVRWRHSTTLLSMAGNLTPETTTQKESPMTQEQYLAFLDLLMCSDPWPISGEDGERAHTLLVEFADAQARERGYRDWIMAYHNEATSGQGDDRIDPYGVGAWSSDEDRERAFCTANEVQDWVHRLVEQVQAPLREAIACGLEQMAMAGDCDDSSAHQALERAVERVRARAFEPFAGKCLMCGHSLVGNEHGFDQNDGYVDGAGNLVHSGRCTYCRECQIQGQQQQAQVQVTQITASDQGD